MNISIFWYTSCNNTFDAISYTAIEYVPEYSVQDLLYVREHSTGLLAHIFQTTQLYSIMWGFRDPYYTGFDLLCQPKSDAWETLLKYPAGNNFHLNLPGLCILLLVIETEKGASRFCNGMGSNTVHGEQRLMLQMFCMTVYNANI